MKQLIALHRIAFRPLALAAALFALAGVGYADDGIDPARRFSWSENSGWNNWRTSLESASVDLRFLSGFVWSENLGWIKLGTGNGPYANTGAGNWGVNIDADNLSGYAWSEGAGWISFSTAQGSATIDRQTGQFGGWAWGENIGWIHLAGIAVDAEDYGARTFYTFLRGTVLCIR